MVTVVQEDGGESRSDILGVREGTTRHSRSGYGQDELLVVCRPRDVFTSSTRT